MLGLDRFYCMDCLVGLKQLNDYSIDCVVTSPPYWGLRDYGIEGQLGLEKTPEEYVSKLVSIFKEVHRVLKWRGTVWLNLGDSYCGSGIHAEHHANPGKSQSAKRGCTHSNEVPSGLKPKDLVGIPWHVAFSLQNDGWWLRQDIIWSKPNPMPESVTDRCTKSHEYVFLLTKSKDYYYDAEAIRESSNTSGGACFGKQNFDSNGTLAQSRKLKSDKEGASVKYWSGANKRSVWTITTKPFSGAHFATFPPDLIEPMIKAGTSEKGVCPECGKPWIRITEQEKINTRPGLNTGNKKSGTDFDPKSKYRQQIVSKTLGWQSSCKCNKEPSPAIVLDPFMGSGTTGLVARKLLRHYIGFELNPEYVKMAQDRLSCIPQRLELF